MTINWFTVIAQVLNFLILMWLLKRYLYKPILNAIDERENRILAQLKDAESKKAEAEKEQEEFNQKNKMFDQQRDELMRKVVAETKEEGQKLREEARHEANLLQAKLERNLVEEQENRNREIAQRVKQEVIGITRKTLLDLSSVSLEEQSLNTFVERLNEIKDDEKKRFTSTLRSGSDPILVRSAFDLSSKQQTEIQKSVSKLLGVESQFKFKTAPELISGIELTTNGYKLSWSISEYVKSLEKSISEGINENPKITSGNR